MKSCHFDVGMLAVHRDVLRKLMTIITSKSKVNPMDICNATLNTSCIFQSAEIWQHAECTLYFPMRVRVCTTLCWSRCISARRSRPSFSAAANRSLSRSIAASPSLKPCSRSSSIDRSSAYRPCAAFARRLTGIFQFKLNSKFNEKISVKLLVGYYFIKTVN